MNTMYQIPLQFSARSAPIFFLLLSVFTFLVFVACCHFFHPHSFLGMDMTLYCVSQGGYWTSDMNRTDALSIVDVGILNEAPILCRVSWLGLGALGLSYYMALDSRKTRAKSVTPASTEINIARSECHSAEWGTVDRPVCYHILPGRCDTCNTHRCMHTCVVTGIAEAVRLHPSAGR